jgi:hypothetical protein
MKKLSDWLKEQGEWLLMCFLLWLVGWFEGPKDKR